MENENFKPYPSGTVSAKLSPDLHQKVINLYNKYFGDQQDIPFKSLLERLLNNINDSALPDNLDLLQKIDELEKSLTEAGHVNFRIDSELAIAKGELVITKEEIQRLKSTLPGDSIPENSIIVPLQPVVDHFLNLMAEAATKKVGRSITKADILKNLFWEQIKSGPGDHLPLIIKKSEMLNKINELKALNNATE